MNARAQASTETITHKASEALAGTGVVVDGAALQQAGRRRLVRIFLARDVADLAPEDTTSTVEPLTLDEVADATRAISDAFDSGDVMGEQPYTLEVSSAGVDRPLTTPEQYRRNVGRLLKLTLADGSTTTDRLTAAGPDHLTLAGRPDSPVPLDEVTRALVQVEFSRPDGKDD